MSAEYLLKAFDTKGLHTRDKLILIYLADTGNDGVFRGDWSSISVFCCCNRLKVIRSIQRLETLGAIRTEGLAIELFPREEAL